MTPGRHGPRIAGASALVLAGFLLVASAHAQVPRVSLEYGAEPGCPSENEFLSDLRSRTARFELAGPSPGSTIYRVMLGAGAGAGSESLCVGRLETVSPRGVVAPREFRGERCRDVADAIALVMALGIDPGASASRAPTPQPPVAGAATAPSPSPTVLAPPPPAPRPPRSYRLHPFAGVGLDASSGIAPHVLAVPGVFIGADFAPDPRRDGVALGLEVRLGAANVSSQVTGVLAETATLRLTAARLDICPLRGVVGPLDAWVCARADAGVLSAAGAGVQAPQTPSHPWFAVGAVARLEASVVGPLLLEVEGGLTFPLVREHFFFDDPQSTVFDVPGVSAAAGGALGVRF